MNKVQTISEGVTPAPFTFGAPPARSCVVDNFTVSYIYIQDAGVFVPPNSTRTVGLPSPQSTVSVLWQTPPGVATPAPGNGNAVIIWSDQYAQTTQASFYPNVGPTPVTITGQPIQVAVTSPNPFPVLDYGTQTTVGLSTWVTFSRLTATTTVAAARAINAYWIWGYHVSIRPPTAGVNDGTFTIKGHVSGTVIDVIEYNEASAAALGSVESFAQYKNPRKLSVNEGIDVVVFTDAGSLSVSGSIDFAIN